MDEVPGNRNPEVDDFLDSLEHSRIAEVRQVREAILAADPGIEETIKWRAPNFRFAGEDRITFRLQPSDRVQLIFHRGAKVRSDSEDFRFDGPTGRLSWAAPDRAVLDFPAGQDEAIDPETIELVRAWIRS